MTPRTRYSLREIEFFLIRETHARIRHQTLHDAMRRGVSRGGEGQLEERVCVKDRVTFSPEETQTAWSKA